MSDIDAMVAIRDLPRAQWQRALDLIGRGMRPADALRQVGGGGAPSVTASRPAKPQPDQQIDDFFLRRLAGVGGDVRYRLEESMEHEAAHAAVGRALGIDVAYLWVTESATGGTAYALDLAGPDAQLRDAAMTIAPQVWLEHFAWRRFPVPPRGCAADNCRLAGHEHAGVDMVRARGLAYQMLDNTATRDELGQIVRRLVAAKLERIVVDGGVVVARVVDLAGRAARATDAPAADSPGQRSARLARSAPAVVPGMSAIAAQAFANQARANAIREARRSQRA